MPSFWNVKLLDLVASNGLCKNGDTNLSDNYVFLPLCTSALSNGLYLL